MYLIVPPLPLSNRLRRKWSKRTKRFDAVPIKEEKTCKFMKTLMKDAVMRRTTNPGLMQQKIILEEDDPRRVLPRLTTAEPMATKDIYLAKLTRM